MKTAARFESLTPYKANESVASLAKRLGCLPGQILKLDANENPYGPSPKAMQALKNLANPHIYPDTEASELSTALAGYTAVAPEYLMVGSGADELIHLLLQVMLEPGDRVLTCPPTFEMYAVNTRLNNGQIVFVPRNADFSLNLEKILSAANKEKPKVIFLTHPNNPDGRLMTREEIIEILKLPALVVLDEAYIEFAGEGSGPQENLSWITEVPKRQNLVVLRTFSKWAGLAGLRVGYGAFPTWLAATLWKAKPPYNVNAAALAAATASLSDLDWLKDNITHIKSERARLFKRLHEIPYLEPYPSRANFILCRVNGRKAEELKDHLKSEGILVRQYGTEFLDNHLRITVDTPQATDRLSGILLNLVDDPLLKKQINSTWKDAPEEIIISAGKRSGLVERATRETSIRVKLSLDGSGQHNIHTGLGFFDHMLAQIAVHGLFDLEIEAHGDLQVDPHHTMEDTALALGDAFNQALGDRKGIIRMGSALVPMDDSLAEVVVDLSGRPYTVLQIEWHSQNIGEVPNSLWPHFFESFALRAGCNLHATLRGGLDDHHQVEAIFKGLGRALDTATRLDPRRLGQVASSKGTLSV